MRTSELERFEKKYIPEPNSGCWLWIAFRNPLGYGMFHTYRKPNQPMELAHRVSRRLYRGEFDENLLVMHRCDNPPCVNPGHLFLGTSKDNAQDSALKGRHWDCSGSGNGRAKLSRHDVARIRMLAPGRDPRNSRRKEILAEEYGVHVGTIRGICSFHLWRGTSS